MKPTPPRRRYLDIYLNALSEARDYRRLLPSLDGKQDLSLIFCRVPFSLTMRDPCLLLYQSPELASDSNVYIDYTREALARGAQRVCHYHAVPNAIKGIEPRIALPYSSISLSIQSEEPVISPRSTVKTSQSVSISDQPSIERTKDLSPASRLEEFIQDARSGFLTPPRAMEEDLPQGDGKDLLPWSDDDVDATDFKNMPDYDPWQDESTHESTPEPDVIAQSLEDLSWEHKSCIRRYIMLDSTQGREQTIPAEGISGR